MVCYVNRTLLKLQWNFRRVRIEGGWGEALGGFIRTFFRPLIRFKMEKKQPTDCRKIFACDSHDDWDRNKKREKLADCFYKSQKCVLFRLDFVFRQTRFLTRTQ